MVLRKTCPNINKPNGTLTWHGCEVNLLLCLSTTFRWCGIRVSDGSGWSLFTFRPPLNPGTKPWDKLGRRRMDEPRCILKGLTIRYLYCPFRVFNPGRLVTKHCRLNVKGVGQGGTLGWSWIYITLYAQYVHRPNSALESNESLHKINGRFVVWVSERIIWPFMKLEIS